MNSNTTENIQINVVASLHVISIENISAPRIRFGSVDGFVVDALGCDSLNNYSLY